MARTVAIGVQSFEKLREENYFYIDKTDFIKEWWESGDDVTLLLCIIKNILPDYCKLKFNLL